MREWALGRLSGFEILAALQQSADDAGEYLAYFTDLAAPLLDGETLKNYWLEAQLTALDSLPSDVKVFGLGLLLQDLPAADSAALLVSLPEELQRKWDESAKQNFKMSMTQLQTLAVGDSEVKVN